jgi:hypothetical protein
MSKNFALIENRKFGISEQLDWHSKSLNVNSVSTNRIAPYAPIQIDFNKYKRNPPSINFILTIQL